jgi:hypothetical protein
MAGVCRAVADPAAQVATGQVLDAAVGGGALGVVDEGAQLAEGFTTI